MRWSEENPREMPWTGTKDPYLIWLSEIILQQTRVAQGWSYFLKFKKEFPTIHKMAAAEEDKILRLWQGLGYYSRARNMHTTSKYISDELNGVFPKTPEELVKLKGVGPYTAAAIASFAFDHPTAVLDGNVFRLLARLFEIHHPIDSTSGKKLFQNLANQLHAAKHSALYNQAIMNFGATICTPKKPNCEICPFSNPCYALANDSIHLLPFKEKKIKKTTRHFNYLLLHTDDKILIRQRVEKDIWNGLYEIPLHEASQFHPPNKLLDIFYPKVKGVEPSDFETYAGKKHLLTHQTILSKMHVLHLSKEWKIPEKDFHWIPKAELNKFAFPKLLQLYFNEPQLSINLSYF